MSFLTLLYWNDKKSLNKSKSLRLRVSIKVQNLHNQIQNSRTEKTQPAEKGSVIKQLSSNEDKTAVKVCKRIFLAFMSHQYLGLCINVIPAWLMTTLYESDCMNFIIKED